MHRVDNEYGMTGRNGIDADGGQPRTRRQVLAATLGAAGMVGLAGCGGDGDSSTATATPESGVTIGLSIPTTGGALNEGRQLRYGYELAKENLNNSEGFAGSDVFQEGLGGGILGEEVELVVENTSSSAEGARKSATTLVQEEGVDMFTGAGSTQEALAHQSVATEESTIYMGGFTPGTAVVEECSEYAFHEMFNYKEAARALLPVLEEEIGADKTFVQMYPRSDVGNAFSDQIETVLATDPLEEGGLWQQLSTVGTRVGVEDYTDPLQQVVDIGPDVAVFDYIGLDGATVLRQAQDIVPEDTEIVVPVFDRPLAQNAGGAIEGVLGTVHWDPSLENEVSELFTDAWESVAQDDDDMTTNPSGLVHLAYTQLFQYAAAAERAGSLDAGDIIAELEGHTYTSGLGGEETMRACDHKATRPVPVVRGRPRSTQLAGVYCDHVTTAMDAGYACDEEPAATCSLDG